MGEWNFDMKSAPQGSFKSVKSGKGETIIHVPEWCIIAVEPHGSVLRSYWIPDAQRWNGTSKETNRVVAWQPWPQFPVSK